MNSIQLFEQKKSPMFDIGELILFVKLAFFKLFFHFSDCIKVVLGGCCAGILTTLKQFGIHSFLLLAVKVIEEHGNNTEGARNYGDDCEHCEKIELNVVGLFLALCVSILVVAYELLESSCNNAAYSL